MQNFCELPNMEKAVSPSGGNGFVVSLGLHVFILGLALFLGGRLVDRPDDNFAGDSPSVLHVSKVVTMVPTGSAPSLQSESRGRPDPVNQGRQKPPDFREKKEKPVPPPRPEAKALRQVKAETQTVQPSQAESEGKEKENKAGSADSGGDAAQPGADAASPAYSSSGAQAFGYNLDSVDKKPQILKNSQVPYPRDARRKKLTGHVLVRFHLDEAGRISQIHIKKSSPPGVFEACTLDEVKKWKFSPAQKGGERVPVWVELPIEFNLR